jgi:hypothetical protein
MSEREEGVFQDLVRRAGPAQRDPGFRMKVLERRETEQFRRRSWALVALAVAAVLGAAAWAILRPASIDVAAVIFFGIGVSALGFFFAPVALRRIASLRR